MLRGTEKQLAWANEIVAHIHETIDWYIEEGKRRGAENNPGYKANVAALTRYRDALDAATYAGDVIELFKGIRWKEDQMENLMSIRAVYRVTLPENNGQAAILCKD